MHDFSTCINAGNMFGVSAGIWKLVFGASAGIQVDLNAKYEVFCLDLELRRSSLSSHDPASDQALNCISEFQALSHH